MIATIDVNLLWIVPLSLSHAPVSIPIADSILANVTSTSPGSRKLLDRQPSCIIPDELIIFRSTSSNFTKSLSSMVDISKVSLISFSALLSYPSRLCLAHVPSSNLHLGAMPLLVPPKVSPSKHSYTSMVFMYYLQCSGFISS